MHGLCCRRGRLGWIMLLAILQAILGSSLSADAGWVFHWPLRAFSVRGPGMVSQTGALYGALAEINRIRSYYNRAPLRLDPRLTQAAAAHAWFMARSGQLEHIESNGSNPGTRARLAGYPWQGIAENIAEGFDDPNEVVRAWMASPSHRGHLLNPSMTDVGIGEAEGYWSLTLAHP